MDTRVSRTINHASLSEVVIYTNLCGFLSGRLLKPLNKADNSAIGAELTSLKVAYLSKKVDRKKNFIVSLIAF